MRVTQLNSSTNMKQLLTQIGVDGGGIKILSSKAKLYVIKISNLHVGGANILKQDALSVGCDVAVPRGTVVAEKKYVDVVLIATKRELEKLSKKELAQPFGLKEVAKELSKILSVKREKTVDIMGVINANDDSFFSQSRFKENFAIDKINQMVEDGATIIDIGGVSSRPNAPLVSVNEELDRVKPILEAIKEQKLYEKVAFSIDSYEPKVIQKALDCGFKIVNDITGLQNDDICKLCAEYDATAIIMHMQGTPQTMQDNPTYDNILEDVYSYLDNQIQKAQSFGVKDIVLDVGIGFGKSLEHNLMLIKNLEYFLSLDKKLLVGVSRKSMIDKIFPSSVADRLAGTLALHLEAYKNGASILRVHDVYEHSQALSVQRSLDLI